MKKNSPSYFENRIANNTWKTYNSLEEKNRELLQMYVDASESIKEELYLIAEKYGKDGVLSLSGMHNKNRLLRLKKEYEKIVKELGSQVQKKVTDNMQKGFTEVYKNTSAGIGDIEYSLPNKKLMEKLLHEPWRGDDFSGRLWKNQKKLAAGLNSLLLTGLQQGKTVTSIAIELHNFVGNSFNNCHRLVRTETMHYLNSASLQRYKDSDLEYVQVWAAKDERTCPECGNYHGKTYSIDKCPALPFHPNCRCTILPVTYDELTLDEQGAITNYISPDAYSLNDKMRRGEELTAPEQKWIIDLNKALNKLPKYSGDISRSLQFKYEEDLENFMSRYVEGETVSEKSFMSATKGFNELYNPDGQVQIYIFDAQNAIDISMFNQQEQEVLYPANKNFTVLETERIDGTYHIFLKEV